MAEYFVLVFVGFCNCDRSWNQSLPKYGFSHKEHKRQLPIKLLFNESGFLYKSTKFEAYKYQWNHIKLDIIVMTVGIKKTPLYGIICYSSRSRSLLKKIGQESATQNCNPLIYNFMYINFQINSCIQCSSFKHLSTKPKLNWICNL